MRISRGGALEGSLEVGEPPRPSNPDPVQNACIIKGWF